MCGTYDSPTLKAGQLMAAAPEALRWGIELADEVERLRVELAQAREVTATMQEATATMQEELDSFRATMATVAMVLLGKAHPGAFVTVEMEGRTLRSSEGGEE